MGRIFQGRTPSLALRSRLHPIDCPLYTFTDLVDHLLKPMGNVTMDVGKWLRSLGLGQFEATFRENGIDADVLRELTEADLEKLGMLLGHRKRLLRAIADLSAPATESILPAAVNSAPEVDAAERRQLTVMFCDLLGSTALATRLDPEDMRSIIAAYHKCCATQISGQGGFVAKYMGDGVLAYFGYPQLMSCVSLPRPTSKSSACCLGTGSGFSGRLPI